MQIVANRILSIEAQYSGNKIRVFKNVYGESGNLAASVAWKIPH